MRIISCTVCKLLRTIGHFLLSTGVSLFNALVWDESQNLKITTFDKNKLETSLYHMVQTEKKVFRKLEPRRRGSRVWQTDGRTDGRTDGQVAFSNSALYRRALKTQTWNLVGALPTLQQITGRSTDAIELRRNQMYIVRATIQVR